MERAQQYGVYFIFKSMEQSPTFRSVMPKFSTADPNYRILHPHRSRYTHYYFYLSDHVLGPMVVRVAPFVPFHTTCYLNGRSFMEQELAPAEIAFRKHDNAFVLVANPRPLHAAADRLTPRPICKQREGIMEYVTEASDCFSRTLSSCLRWRPLSLASASRPYFPAGTASTSITRNRHRHGVWRGLDCQ